MFFLPLKKNCVSYSIDALLTWPQTPCSSRSVSCQREDLPQVIAIEQPHSTTLLPISWPSSKLLYIHSLLPRSLLYQGLSSWAGFAPYLSLLTGRAVSFHCVLVRIGRLVTGYLHRGQWGLSPVIQWKTGSVWWLCGSAWRRMRPAILADTLLPKDMVLLQTMISHRLLRDSLSAWSGPLPIALWWRRYVTSSVLVQQTTFLPHGWASRRGPAWKYIWKRHMWAVQAGLVAQKLLESICQHAFACGFLLYGK